MSTKPGSLIPVRAQWRTALLVCRKCQKKLGNEGFGPRGDERLGKALVKTVKQSPAGRGAKFKGRKAPIGVVEVGCLKVCPKRGVTVVDGRRPDRWLVVGEGASGEAVLGELGVDLGYGGNVVPGPRPAR